MIQDIAPHKYDSCYRSQKPQDGDYALYIKDNKALLIERTFADDRDLAETDKSLPGEDRKRTQMEIPAIKELEEFLTEVKDHAGYLFSIDDKAYFLIEDFDNGMTDAEAPASMSWQGTQYFRQMEPMYQGFAAITATQLWRWKDSRRFCGHCGCPTIHSETERALVCPKCGQIEYPKISPAVIVAITNGDKLLMSRYRDRPYGGYALIAGFVEIGESFEETVHREVMEEVGLKVKNVRYYKSQPWAFSDTEMIGFFAELDGDDTIVLQEDELSEADWYSKEEIADDKLSISVGSEMKMFFKYGTASVF